MAESRGVRAGSRRKTPIPQPEKAPARASRRLRSASRDIEPILELHKSNRRSTRQASVARSESEDETLKPRRAQRKPAKEVAGGLTIVEEIDTEIALQAAPGTPQRIDIDLEQQALFRSPGAASEMSGTTAISSFSMIEAEFLEPKYILKHMRKLCDVAEDFLQHLAPESGSIEDDHRNIREMQKPDSDFAKDYRDFEVELNVHLKHFKSEEHKYIHPRAVHRALFGSYNDVGALQSGVDLVFYLGNLLVFAKHMIHSDRSDKDMWNTLQQLDSTFPNQFMRSLITEGSSTAAGDSTLLEMTFELGLDLRTQLAILLMERWAHNRDFNSDEALDEVFAHPEASQGNGDIIRGWNVAALGGEETSLSPRYQERIKQRLLEMQPFFSTDSQSLENGDTVDLDGLSANFPWNATILRLLQWVRFRHRELSESIEAIGGPTAILDNVKKAMETPQPVSDEGRPTTAPRDSPRKKRTSFGRPHRRRSSRKFDPNAPIDVRAIDALKARERDSGVYFDPKVLQPGEEFEQVAEEEEVAEQIGEQSLVPATAPDDAEAEREQNVRRQMPIEEEQQQGDATLVAGEEDIEDMEKFPSSGPPKGTQDILSALKSVGPQGKENRKGSLFDRQVTAQRVEFGSGFDSSQPTPGPSNRILSKGKQRVDPPPSVSRKRARPEAESDDEDDVFEASERVTRVQERRQKAPVSKRARVETPSSAPVPPSHQPVRATADDRLTLPRASAPAAPQPTQEDSVSKPEGPEMTRVPPSTYQAQHRLALQNSAIGGAGRMRQPRRTWTLDAEEAFVEYMARLPRRYANIKELDESADGYGLLTDFTQVNLKDKARTMAINMIKSGTGLREGFEDIIKPDKKDGIRLAEAGYQW
ncbi:uncharacterized protein EKO05_0005071 [Ascochyta rabiei]|uniref:Chromatin binding n=1 Tax=Didymella rabiei TaxID=5454 RepID=A0A163BU07_DIDRA|nr:uncharacterized protein EKO05_0005071 [Ascochyta rabiei]KZM21989.1 chromatin binding [Ascochyta rabiei]UPX14593.1 hypothetical protein EKO05_0005071 [Ascochyta rabiei]